jgi:hypothetical protein
LLTAVPTTAGAMPWDQQGRELWRDSSFTIATPFNLFSFFYWVISAF